VGTDGRNFASDLHADLQTNLHADLQADLRRRARGVHIFPSGVPLVNPCVNPSVNPIVKPDYKSECKSGTCWLGDLGSEAKLTLGLVRFCAGLLVGRGGRAGAGGREGGRALVV